LSKAMIIFNWIWSNTNTISLIEVIEQSLIRRPNIWWLNPSTNVIIWILLTDKRVNQELAYIIHKVQSGCQMWTHLKSYFYIYFLNDNRDYNNQSWPIRTSAGFKKKTCLRLHLHMRYHKYSIWDHTIFLWTNKMKNKQNIGTVPKCNRKIINTFRSCQITVRFHSFSTVLSMTIIKSTDQSDHSPQRILLFFSFLNIKDLEW
jgi:hypothetical protein